MTIKNKLKYGSKDILNSDFFDTKKVKVRITTFIDEDILAELKNYSKKNGIKYQTALNAILRAVFEKPTRKDKVVTLSEENVRKIVREEMKKRA